MIRRIGLTGGIGSGKSTVAEMLRMLGAQIVDTDAIARSITAPGGEAIEALRRTFGADAIAADGSLDREWMRHRAFADSAVRGALESLLHPLIGRHAEAQAEAAEENTCVVFDVPLLVESAHWRERVERVLVVDCPPAVQVDRVMRRSGWTREAVERVIAQQATRERRRAAADGVIDNRGASMPALQAAVHSLWKRWSVAG